MTSPLRLCLLLHNHQPVGNFDFVFEQAYRDSYLPFLDVFADYDLPISLHTSGPLMEWLDAHHPEYVDRLAEFVAAGRIEIVGGAFYEPILTMIPPVDRVGQIRRYAEWLTDRLGAKVQGMWMPERVWEQSLASDLAEAGVRYTLLDDFHFISAGLAKDELHGYYITEDNGRVVSVFPGSERLRYLVPFAEPHETIDYLREIANRQPGAVVVFGDDGEKFGSWPETKQHVYDNGWLRRFFDALSAERDWLQVVTAAEALDSVPPRGKIFIPQGSYREMTEWVLPVDLQMEFEDLKHSMEHDERWPRLAQFVRGGFWRNFRVKYGEANEMYSRMMHVSRRVQEALPAAVNGNKNLIDEARAALYRGQCNCPYWHGAFGGIYLPHLRNAIYNQLIEADNFLDAATGRAGYWIEVSSDDYNFDLRQEVRLANPRLIAWLAPANGGQLYELDVRSIAHNLLATLMRRPEAYHRKVLAGENAHGENVASIHDRVVFKQAGLDQRLQYDRYERKSLIDHFYDEQAGLEAIARGEAREWGDFIGAPYEAVIRRSTDRVQVQLRRDGHCGEHAVRITKGVTLSANSSILEIAYLLEGLPPGKPLHFGVEFNFSGLPAGADDRYFHNERGQHHGQLGAQLDLHDEREIGLTDEWLGIDVRLSFDRPTHLWTFPIETVSQSEGGFELVHQSVVVQPHWFVQGDNNGRWSTTMELALDTAMAESRRQEAAMAMA